MNVCDLRYWLENEIERTEREVTRYARAGAAEQDNYAIAITKLETLRDVLNKLDI